MVIACLLSIGCFLVMKPNLTPRLARRHSILFEVLVHVLHLSVSCYSIPRDALAVMTTLFVEIPFFALASDAQQQSEFDPLCMELSHMQLAEAESTIAAIRYHAHNGERHIMAEVERDKERKAERRERSLSKREVRMRKKNRCRLNGLFCWQQSEKTRERRGREN